MGKEFVYDNPSIAVIHRMSVDELTTFQASLQRGKAFRGSTFLREQRQRVTRELATRRRRGRRSQMDEAASEGFEILHEVLDHQKLATSTTGIIVEAHNDDFSMSRLARHLSNEGTAVVIVTLTDGAARGLTSHTPEELAATRWNEGIAAGKLAGVAAMHRIGLPDGNLVGHQEEAGKFLGEIIEQTKPAFVLAPNIVDEHIDHMTAHEVALEVAGSTPVYGMDTITGYDRYGIPLQPDRYVRLSTRTARREKQIYLANMTQVNDIPKHQVRDVMNVLGMTRRRGREIGVPHAAVVFNALNTKSDPLSEIVTFQKAA